MTELNIKLKQYVLPTMKNFLMAIRASNFSCPGYPSFTRLNTAHVTSPEWVIWLIQLFEMYKPQVDLFSRLIQLLYQVDCVLSCYMLWSLWITLLPFEQSICLPCELRGSMTLKPLQALFDSSRLFNTSLNTKSKIHYPAQDVERIIQRQYKNT